MRDVIFQKIAENIFQNSNHFLKISNIFAQKQLPSMFLSEYDVVWSVDLNKQFFSLSEYDMTSDREANKHEFVFKRIRLGYEAENQ